MYPSHYLWIILCTYINIYLSVTRIRLKILFEERVSIFLSYIFKTHIKIDSQIKVKIRSKSNKGKILYLYLTLSWTKPTPTTYVYALWHSVYQSGCTYVTVVRNLVKLFSFARVRDIRYTNRYLKIKQWIFGIYM